ncbi:phosphoglycerate dehydrogenase [Agrococcus sp. ARC_14]|uniref:phosphoglycerate dehydrogenase n=1 Tax=Agrococcus sp. ARC_14 TaxID=2919927 RepID=UPI001F062CB8|nr:phosphoglycerate dehydrogenase [Agrococcus sp. ARC_14]MCH1882438.1 phosphoglycerate dehydrogenase [Agrococcus sp. ARC_14]
MSKPVVLIAEELSAATVDALGPDFDVRNVDGTDREALFAALADASAVLVRSATKIDAEALSHAPKLRVVARAGVGLDNVEIPAATKAGVMVVNAPTSNIVSAAELAIAHLLGLARHIPAADASLKRGEWKRSAFTGVELYEKTVGIVGLGRIGVLVAERLAAFGTKLIAFDPFVSPARAAQLGVELRSLDELMAESDFITIHIPRTPETVGLIGGAQFALAKPSLRIVNASRGGIIDEAALAEALRTGAIAGAGIDVFVSEPPKDDALTSAPNIQVTPHLGASTDEAQEKAGVAVARSVRLALAGDLVPDAVNVAGGIIDEYVRPGIPLAERLGQFAAGLAGGPVESVDVAVHGELAGYDVKVLRLAALKGFFSSIVSEQVTFVNAPVIAESRGVTSALSADERSDEYRNVVEVVLAMSDGRRVSVEGTLTGPKQIEKIVGVNGQSVEVPLAQHFVVMEYVDRPGIVATYGSAFGEAGINIAGMQIARTEAGGDALSIITIDQAAPDELVEQLGASIEATTIRQIEIREL